MVSEFILAITMSAMMATGAQAIPGSPSRFKETACLTEAIFFEAGNRPKIEKEAVASVILNRKAKPGFPDNICRITYQRGQFSYQTMSKNKAFDARQYANIYESAEVATRAIAEDVRDRTGGATHFVNVAIAKDTAWLSKMKYLGNIGPHSFYIEPKHKR